MYRQFILILFALIYCVAVAQTDTYVVKYTDKSMLTLEFPLSTKVSKDDSGIVFVTPDITLSIPNYKVKSYFLADEAYLTDSIPSSCSAIKCQGTQVIYFNPRHTIFTQILRPNHLNYKSNPPSESPEVFNLSEEPKNTYTLDFGPVVNVTLNR